MLSLTRTGTRILGPFSHTAQITHIARGGAFKPSKLKQAADKRVDDIALAKCSEVSEAIFRSAGTLRGTVTASFPMVDRSCRCRNQFAESLSKEGGIEVRSYFQDASGKEVVNAITYDPHSKFAAFHFVPETVRLGELDLSANSTLDELHKQIALKAHCKPPASSRLLQDTIKV